MWGASNQRNRSVEREGMDRDTNGHNKPAYSMYALCYHLSMLFLGQSIRVNP